MGIHAWHKTLLLIFFALQISDIRAEEVYYPHTADGASYRFITRREIEFNPIDTSENWYLSEQHFALLGLTNPNINKLNFCEVRQSLLTFDCSKTAQPLLCNTDKNSAILRFPIKPQCNRETDPAFLHYGDKYVLVDPWFGATIETSEALIYKKRVRSDSQLSHRWSAKTQDGSQVVFLLIYEESPRRQNEDLRLRHWLQRLNSGRPLSTPYSAEKKDSVDFFSGKGTVYQLGENPYLYLIFHDKGTIIIQTEKTVPFFIRLRNQ